MKTYVWIIFLCDTDEKAAYTIFIYKKMNWAYVPGRPVNVGMTGSSVKQLKDTDTALVSMLDQVPGNVGKFKSVYRKYR